MAALRSETACTLMDLLLFVDWSCATMDKLEEENSIKRYNSLNLLVVMGGLEPPTSAL